MEKENRNNQTWEEHKNQTPQKENEGRGSKEETSNQDRPGDRLKDGTNDFVNGDQEPTSEKPSDSGEEQSTK